MKFINLFLIVLVLALQIGCKTPTTSGPDTIVIPPPVEIVTPLPPNVGQSRIALSWENTTEAHPERIPWSDKLIGLFDQDFGLFSVAKDVTEICPKFHGLTKEDKLKALAEFMVSTAYFESGYKPALYSVDVGSKGDKESWSVGLYQMSGNDSSAKQIGANFKTLQDPLVNIEVAMIQMKKQISKRGEFFLDNSDSMRYWAVLLERNRYSKITEIKARTLKNAPFCK